ncbi:MAG: response regulator transcription factor [Pseudomonadota bacterium]
MTVIKSKPISVLLVSESPLVIFGLQRLLEPRHPAIAVAGTVTSRNVALMATQDPQLNVALIDIDGSIGVELVNEVVSAHTCRVLVMTATTDPAVIDAAVAFGASGIVRNTDPVDVYVKALERVAEGELWLDRATTGRIFLQMSRSKNGKGQEQNPEQTRLEKLTRKERMTVAEIGRDAGASSQEIAERLHISESTLRNHLTSIYAKLELSNRVELYAFAQRNLT